jgi:hypothetical protein
MTVFVHFLCLGIHPPQWTYTSRHALGHYDAEIDGRDMKTNKERRRVTRAKKDFDG